MSKVSTALLTVALVFAAVPVLACSCHGTAAAAQVNTWLGGGAANNGNGGNDNATDGGVFSGIPGLNVTGGETNHVGTGNFHNDYWVTITGPNGFTQTLTATTQNGRTTVIVTDKDGNQLNTVTISSGAQLENFLRDTAIAIIRTLLPDAQGSDYVG
jgi:hypothetical protein